MGLKISPVLLISAGLVALTLGILLVASLLGIVPDEEKERVRSRVQLSEALAVQFSVLAEHNDFASIQRIIDATVSRNKHVLSAAIRNVDQGLISSSGSHPEDTQTILSAPDFIKIPLYKDEDKWATVEIRFTSIQNDSSFVNTPMMQLLIFVSITGFIIYFLLMRKVLRHLDPFNVVPARVRAVMNAMSEGVCLIDDKENIVLANDAFIDKTGLSFNYIKRKHLSELGWANNESNKRYPWQDVMKNGESFTHVEIKYEIEVGNIITYISNGTAIADRDGKVRGALVTFNDVTELEKINRQLLRQQDMEQQRIQWLEAMAGFLRHEMNTALLGAASSVKLLDKTVNLDEEGKHFVELANRSHLQIKELIDSITNATSLESAFLKEKTEPVRVDILFEEHTKNYYNIYPDNEIVLELDSNEVVVSAQKDRLIQLLDKLVSNAIDYSEQGTPVIISCKKVSNSVKIKVMNQGVPIQGDNKKLFDLFTSYRENDNNKGIGLYVVRLIAEGYGGTVNAENRKDVTGAEFIVTLPIVG